MFRDGLQHRLIQKDLSYGMYSLQEYLKNKKQKIDDIYQQITGITNNLTVNFRKVSNNKDLLFTLFNKLDAICFNDGRIIEFNIRNGDNSLLKSIENQNKTGSEIGSITDISCHKNMDIN